jgi:hypothetical protein
VEAGEMVRLSRWLVGSLLSIIVSVAVAQEFVAGEQPDRRPSAAPVMPEPPGGPERLATLAKGVEAPIPEGVVRLNVPGRWFTPFERPGMTAPYDLRGWHQAAPTKSNAKAEGSK